MDVIKVGGSLLGWPGLPARLAAEVAGRSGRDVVLICGGGPFADVLRDLDRVYGLGEGRSHALALRVLDMSARVLADLLPGSIVVEDLGELAPSWGRGRVPILAPRRFLDADDAASDALGHAWTTTTDSIAARVAAHLGAEELLLLKSVSLPPEVCPEGAARLGLVDPTFPRIARVLPRVSYANARDPGGKPRAFAKPTRTSSSSHERPPDPIAGGEGDCGRTTMAPTRFTEGVRGPIGGEDGPDPEPSTRGRR